MNGKWEGQEVNSNRKRNRNRNGPNGNASAVVWEEETRITHFRLSRTIGLKSKNRRHRYRLR